ncbi:MAG: hypothetical protein JNM00_05560 [Flavobacteriales bacterium]|nr:hypothetical protein [Flavobacteriales bacterium]
MNATPTAVHVVVDNNIVLTNGKVDQLVFRRGVMAGQLVYSHDCIVVAT